MPPAPRAGGKNPINQVASAQAPFDKRIQTLAMPMQDVRKQIHRGYMVQKEALPGYKSRGPTGKFVFHFLYNPSVIDASYSVQTSGAPLSYLFPNAGDTGSLAVPINQSVNWTIMFDRTYELNKGAYDDRGRIIFGDSSVPNLNGITADPTVYGVLADVLQLSFFTGMHLTGKQASNSSSILGAATSGTSISSSQGFMMMVPCYVYFGGQNVIRYYGFINNWDVTYTHFTQWMVPMRCVITIGFTMLPPPATAALRAPGPGGIFPTPNGQPPPLPIGVLP